MTRFAAPALLACAVAFTAALRADDKDDKAGAGLKELEGNYKLLSAERDGRPPEQGVIDGVTVAVKGDEFVMSFGGEKKVAKIKLKPDATPAAIDLTPQDGPEKGKSFPGIYKLEKGVLTLAFSEKGARPKEFKSENEVTLLQLKKSEK